MYNLFELLSGGSVGAFFGGLFYFLAKRYASRHALVLQEKEELSNYRQELHSDLEEARRELIALKEQRIALLENSTMERLKLEERISRLEREKESCLDRIEEMAAEVASMAIDIETLRSKLSMTGFKSETHGRN